MPHQTSVRRVISMASTPPATQAALWVSPRCSRSRSAARQRSPTGSPGQPWDRRPAWMGWPLAAVASPPWRSSSVARSMPSGRAPPLASLRMRVRLSVAPAWRASRRVSGSVAAQPRSTDGDDDVGVEHAEDGGHGLAREPAHAGRAGAEVAGEVVQAQGLVAVAGPPGRSRHWPPAAPGRCAVGGRARSAWPEPRRDSGPGPPGRIAIAGIATKGIGWPRAP